MLSGRLTYPLPMAGVRPEGCLHRAHEALYFGPAAHSKEERRVVGEGPERCYNLTTQAPSDLSPDRGVNTSK